MGDHPYYYAALRQVWFSAGIFRKSDFKLRKFDFFRFFSYLNAQLFSVRRKGRENHNHGAMGDHLYYYAPLRQVWFSAGIFRKSDFKLRKLWLFSIFFHIWTPIYSPSAERGGKTITMVQWGITYSIMLRWDKFGFRTEFSGNPTLNYGNLTFFDLSILEHPIILSTLDKKRKYPMGY